MIVENPMRMEQAIESSCLSQGQYLFTKYRNHKSPTIKGEQEEEEGKKTNKQTKKTAF